MFQTTYQPLSDHSDWGQVALLPWDAEIFGFPVGEFRIGDAKSIAERLDEMRAAFDRWTEANRVELVMCSIPVEAARARALLSSLAFEFIDVTLQVTQSRVQSLQLPPTRIKVRHATPDDQARVEEIAEQAFRFGRYSADARFPPELSNKRNRIWLRNAFKNLGEASRLYVIESQNRVNGFLHVNIQDAQGNMTIFAMDPNARGARLTMDLCVGCLREMQAEGLRQVSSKMSAANLDMANLLVYFDFRFSQPQAVYHWHAPNAPHLLEWKRMFG